MTKKALLVTDVTDCFGPKGELPVPAGIEEARSTVSAINRMIEGIENNPHGWALIVFSRDWHDDNSPHFEKWPKHGVKFTQGSEFYPGLITRSTKIPIAIVSKGLGKVDGYSPFDPMPDVNIILVMPDGRVYLWEGDLDSLAVHLGVVAFFNSGWAKNYCVEAGNMAAIKKGDRVYLLTDATDGVNVSADPDNHMEKSDKRMVDAGVIFTTTKEVLNA